MMRELNGPRGDIGNTDVGASAGVWVIVVISPSLSGGGVSATTLASLVSLW
jgi:hypothetical protein